MIDDIIMRAQKDVDTYVELLKNSINENRIESSIAYAQKLSENYNKLMTLQFAKMELEAPTD